MKYFFVVFGIACICTLCMIPAYTPIESDYNCCIDVDKAEKIPQALSNAVEDVSSREFIVVGTSVKYCVVDKTFRIEVSGISDYSLLKLGE